MEGKAKGSGGTGSGPGILFSSHGFFARRRNRKLKETQGISRDIMVIGSTGYRTFANSDGELHNVVKNCREARIMLLNPYSEGAEIRARSISDPDITKSRLASRSGQHCIFEGTEVPEEYQAEAVCPGAFFEDAISGDYIWVKHYHAGCDVLGMPEHIFRHIQSPAVCTASFTSISLTSEQS